MTAIDTVVIGAGHAGLAVSRLLSQVGREHIVLDRGRVAERWRSERWDSLHLLTPNWMTRLPGWLYTGADQEGFMSSAEFITYLERYAASFAAPVITGTTVEQVSPNSTGEGYDVATDYGTWRARQVVVATGPWGTPAVPGGIDTSAVEVVASNAYRNPAQLPDGGVLVVGASSSGVQIADELSRAGRRVVLAVGRHTRMPRRYRGMDIYWWLESTGRLAQTIDEVRDHAAARTEPSMQLVGRNDPGRYAADLDLATLHGRGVQLVGRLDGIDGSGKARFRDDLRGNIATADRRMHRFLDAVDRHIDATGLTAEVWSGVRPGPIRLSKPSTHVDLRAAGISTVVTAAGYRPDHSWLRLPIIGADGHIRQHRGVTPAPGVYVVGKRFQHRRDAGSIDGARHDAASVVSQLGAGSGADAASTTGSR